jgi:hypothetical protein
VIAFYRPGKVVEIDRQWWIFQTTVLVGEMIPVGRGGDRVLV